jgi:hypothetical protein
MIPWTAEMLKIRFQNYLVSLNSGTPGGGYAVVRADGQVTFKVDKLIAWNKEFGNELNIRMGMLFMLIGGGLRSSGSKISIQEIHQHFKSADQMEYWTSSYIITRAKPMNVLVGLLDTFHSELIMLCILDYCVSGVNYAT